MASGEGDEAASPSELQEQIVQLRRMPPTELGTRSDAA